MEISSIDAAFVLIEILFQQNKINQATYSNVLQHKNLHISQNKEKGV